MSRIFSVIGVPYEPPGQRRARDREIIRPAWRLKPPAEPTPSEVAWKQIRENLERWNREHGRISFPPKEDSKDA